MPFCKYNNIAEYLSIEALPVQAFNLLIARTNPFAQCPLTLLFNHFSLFNFARGPTNLANSSVSTNSSKGVLPLAASSSHHRL
ncbi:hypothetical protein MJO29_010547 [Puccinia striiformis f. sp. tritici]|nr:hypothetical protein MJO29_010547 [Puccinia striiformis f. sp. tritici]